MTGRFTFALGLITGYVQHAIQDVKDTRKIVLARRVDALELEIAGLIRTCARHERRIMDLETELVARKRLCDELGAQAVGLLRTRSAA